MNIKRNGVDIKTKLGLSCQVLGAPNNRRQVGLNVSRHLDSDPFINFPHFSRNPTASAAHRSYNNRTVLIIWIYQL